MSDFVEDKPVEIEVDGRIFKFHEPIGPEYDAWLEKYIKVVDDDKFELSIVAKNKGVLEFVVDAPYEIEGKPFSEASVEKRVELLQKLKPSIRGALLKKINGLINLEDEVKKK